MNIKRLFIISRPIYYLPVVAIYWLGFLLSGNEYSLSLIIGALLLTLPMGLVVFGLNDISDIESDAKNARKGSSQGAILQTNESKYLVKIIWFVAIFSSLFGYVFCGCGYLLDYTGIILLGVAYSVKPIRLKTRPIIDSISNGIWVIFLLLCGFWLGYGLNSLVMPNMYYLLALGFLITGLHAAFTIPDYAADKYAGDNTIAVRFGIRFTRYFSLFLLGLSAFMIMLSSLRQIYKYVALVNIFIWAIMLLFAPKFTSAKKFAKFEISCGYISVLLLILCVFIKQFL